MEEFDVRKTYRRIYTGFLHGHRINSVSIPAEAAFWRLLVVADDYGNLAASPRVLMGTVFPCRESVGPIEIAGWIGELEGANLVVRYSESDVDYLHVVGFVEMQPTKNGKRARKHPPYPGESRCIQVNPDASRCNRVPSESESESGIEPEQKPESESAPKPPTTTEPEFTVARPDADAELRPKSQIEIMRATAGLELDQAFVRELANSTLTMLQIDYAAGATMSQHGVKNKAGYFRSILENDYGYRKARRA